MITQEYTIMAVPPDEVCKVRKLKAYKMAQNCLQAIHNEIAEELLIAPDTMQYTFQFDNQPNDVIGLVYQALQEAGWIVRYRPDSRELIIDLPTIVSECPAWETREHQSKVEAL